MLKPLTSIFSPAAPDIDSLSDNESVSGVAGENLDVRGFNIFDHETLILGEAVGTGDSAFKVKLSDGTVDAAAIVSRFPLGSYIQIGSEIMRVSHQAHSVVQVEMRLQ